MTTALGTRGRRGRTSACLLVAAGAALLTLTACGADVDAEPTITPSPTISVPSKEVPKLESSASPSPDPDASAQAASGDAEASAEVEPPTIAEQAEAIEQELFDHTNAARDEAGEDALEWSDCAAEQATDRAVTARAKDELEHESLDFECDGTLVGENLVRGDGPAGALHELWMDSETHRDNIEHDDFSRVGIACVAHGAGDRTAAAENKNDIGGWVCSQMFYG